jgi:hypothetical protein
MMMMMAVIGICIALHGTTWHGMVDYSTFTLYMLNEKALWVL